MKLFLDQGVPRRAAELLRAAGVRALHAAEAGLSSASDVDIIKRCTDQAEVLVTLDADFHALVALSGKCSPSVIRLRIEGLRGPELAHLLQDLTTDIEHELTAGALVTVEPKSVRVRRLPIFRRNA